MKRCACKFLKTKQKNFDNKQWHYQIKCSDWLLSLNVCLSFCFSSSKHNIMLLLKYICLEFISIKLPWDNKSKSRKNKKYSSVRKSYSTSRKGIGGRKEKEKISKSKTTTLTYFDNLKKRQQDQHGKNWRYSESFMSLTISNLRTTAFCFENTKLLK